MKKLWSRLSLGVCVIAIASLGSACSETKLPRLAQDPVLLEIHIKGAPYDSQEHEPFTRAQSSLYEVISEIQHASNSASVRGLFLWLGPMPGAWGRARDIEIALDAFKQKGKPIYCHFEDADNVSYRLAATSCDSISMSPGGILNAVGPSAVMFFARPLLASLGIEAEILHVGPYKGAGDILMRDSVSPEAKEAMDEILDRLSESLLTALQSRLQISRAQAQAIIDTGPFHSDSAQEHKLIDHVVFDDEAREQAKIATKASKVREVKFKELPEEVSLTDLLRLLSGEKKVRKRRGTRIALVNLQGEIIESDEKASGETTSGPFVEAMRKFRDDDKVKAVVLRINSPGGSALASDRMWQAAMQVSKAKPLVASVSDMAASGGYYVASAAQQILSHRESLVGSIGVVGGKINVAALNRKIGIRSTVFKRGKNAAWTVLSKGLDRQERKSLQNLLLATYERFIERVSQGRNLDRKVVERAAGGRIMSGALGKEWQLVDAFGGLSEALLRAQHMANLPANAEIEEWPHKRGVVDSLAHLLEGGVYTKPEDWVTQQVRDFAPLSYAATLQEALAEPTRAAAILPFVLQVR